MMVQQGDEVHAHVLMVWYIMLAIRIIVVVHWRVLTVRVEHVTDLVDLGITEGDCAVVSIFVLDYINLLQQAQCVKSKYKNKR